MRYVHTPTGPIPYSCATQRKTTLTLNDELRQLVNNCVKGLHHLNKPFKYAVSAIVVQNVGAGCATSAGFYWDTEKDGTPALSLPHLLTQFFVYSIDL